MDDIERAIKDFMGPANVGLRAKLRLAAYGHGGDGCIPTTQHDLAERASNVRAIGATVALGVIGRAKLEAVAAMVERGAAK